MVRNFFLVYQSCLKTFKITFKIVKYIQLLMLENNIIPLEQKNIKYNFNTKKAAKVCTGKVKFDLFSRLSSI